MELRCASVAVAASLFVVLGGCKSDKKEAEPAPAEVTQTREPSKPLTVSDTASVSVTARVRSVNQATRVLTLEDSSGRSVDVIAGPRIQRLQEVRVGDSVKVEYTATLVAELRPPTPEESANPIAVVAVTERSPKGTTPAGSRGVATRVVATVVTVDVPNMRVTLSGPMGDTTTVRARNPENIRKLSPGDTIVITFSEATALSLIKAAEH
jgi:hypothetical protein